MYYLKFVSKKGIEKNFTCFSYTIQPRDNWSFVTAELRDTLGLFESNFCVGEEVDFCSMFVMNINGQLLDKVVTKGD